MNGDVKWPGINVIFKTTKADNVLYYLLENALSILTKCQIGIKFF